MLSLSLISAVFALVRVFIYLSVLALILVAIWLFWNVHWD